MSEPDYSEIAVTKRLQGSITVPLPKLKASLFWRVFIILRAKTQRTGCSQSQKTAKQPVMEEVYYEDATGGISKNKLFQIQQDFCRGCKFAPRIWNILKNDNPRYALRQAFG